MRRLVASVALASLLVGSVKAEELTHECYYHQYYYDMTFGDILNIYGCVYGNLSRYFNSYDVQGLKGGVRVRVSVTPTYSLSRQLLDDIQIVWYPLAPYSDALAFSSVVKTNSVNPGTVILDWTPPASGQYLLVVSTTYDQDWNVNNGMLGPYDILITQIAQATPTPIQSVTPTPQRGRDTPTPGPSPTPTRTPTPADERRPRIIQFR